MTGGAARAKEEQLKGAWIDVERDQRVDSERIGIKLSRVASSANRLKKMPHLVCQYRDDESDVLPPGTCHPASKWIARSNKKFGVDLDQVRPSRSASVPQTIDEPRLYLGNIGVPGQSPENGWHEMQHFLTVEPPHAQQSNAAP